MRRLNEKVLDDSFGIKPDSINELTIKLNEQEKNCLSYLISHYLFDEKKHFYESGEDEDHIYLHWLKFLNGLPDEYKREFR